MVSAYKHVRDALIDGTPIDPEIKNLVNVIPHREYRDGFLFHNIKEFPDRENNDHAREPETPQIEENQTVQGHFSQETTLDKSFLRASKSMVKSIIKSLQKRLLNLVCSFIT